MSYVDIGIIALLLLFAALGVWKGIQKTSLALGAFVISFIVAFFLANVIAEAMLGIEGVKNFVLGKEGFSLFTWVRDAKGDAPSSFIIEYFYNPIAKTVPKKLLTATFTPADATAVSAAFSIFSAIVGVGLFIVIRALLCIVTMIIKSYIPRKKSVGNRVAGLFVGAARGGVWALVFTIVFSVLGGLPAMSKVEMEFEDSSMAKYLNTAAYSIKNSMFIPDEEMLERLIMKGGFVSDKKPENPPEDEKPDPIKTKRYELYADIMNLNYINGNKYSVDQNSGAIVDTGVAELLDTSKYADTGFKQALDSIMAYNNSLGAAIRNDDGLLKDVTQETLDAYGAARSNIYNVMFGTDGMTTALRNYDGAIHHEDFGHRTNADAVKQANEELSGCYNSIVAALDTLKAEYAKFTLLTVADGAGELGLPANPELIQDSIFVEPAPIVVKRYNLSAAFMNLNYSTGEKFSVNEFCEIVQADNGFTAVDSTAYEENGFKPTVDAIIAYNNRLGELIAADDGLLAAADDDTLTAYEQARAQIRTALFDADGLITALDKYVALLHSPDFGKRTDAAEVEQANAELTAEYDKITSALETLKTEYAKLELLTVADGAGELTLPALPALVQDEVATAPPVEEPENPPVDEPDPAG